MRVYIMNYANVIITYKKQLQRVEYYHQISYTQNGFLANPALFFPLLISDNVILNEHNILFISILFQNVTASYREGQRQRYAYPS